MDDTPVDVTIYSREHCHLCSVAKATIERVSSQLDVPVSIDEIDVDESETLRETYGDRVPYVLVDGRPAYKIRVDEADLRDRLESAVDDR
ncbi:MAG: glutaredoxin family protein [Halobacteriota archaeon]